MNSATGSNISHSLLALSLINQFAFVARKRISVKMAFITFLLSLMRYFAVLPDEQTSKISGREVIMFIVRSSPLLFTLIPSFGYLILHFDPNNVFELTDLIYTITLMDCNFNGYLIIAIRQLRFRDLINELKSFIKKSKCGRNSNLTQFTTNCHFQGS